MEKKSKKRTPLWICQFSKNLKKKDFDSFAVGSANLIETNILSKKITPIQYSQPLMFTQKYAIGGEVVEHVPNVRKNIAQINSLDFSNYEAKN
jgi:hypothetical protein